MGDFSVGYSHSGYFPFEPLVTPSAINGQQVFGNFFGSGVFSVNNFEIDGEILLDLNRQSGPGQGGFSAPANMQSDFVNLFNRGGSVSIESIFAALGRIELGVNAAVSYSPDLRLGKDENGNNIVSALGEISILVADASLMFIDGNLFAPRGVADPLKGGIAFLQQVGIQGTAMTTIDRFVGFDTGQFRLEVNANASARIGGFAPDGKFRLILNNDMIRAELMVKLPLVGRAEVSGFINWRFGTFVLKGSANLSLGFFGSVNMNFRFGNSTAQKAKIDVTASAELKATWKSYGVGLSFRADISVNFATGAFSLNGTAKGTAYLGVFGSLSISVTIGTSGFSIDLPWPIPDISISFPSFLHAEGPARLTRADAISADALPSIIDEAIRRLSGSGLTLEQALLLRGVEFRVSKIDNEKRQLGYAAGNVVHIDDDAAGHGWFIDPMPRDDAEFDPATLFADSDSDAAGRMDLLSVIMHELTHVLEARYPESDFHFGESVTSESIATGQRFFLLSPAIVDDDDEALDDIWADDPAELLDTRW